MGKIVKDISNKSSSNKSFVPDLIVRELPSKFKSYPEGVEISYKPYLFGELTYLGESNLTKVEKLVKCLDGINVTGMNKLDLAFFDVLFIGMLRKISTFSRSQFSVTSTCQKCDEVFTSSKNHSEIEFEDILAEELPVCVTTDDNVELEFSPLTVRNYLKLSKSDSLTDSNILAASISNKTYEEAKEIVDSAEGILVQLLEEIDSLIDLSVQTVTCKCPECSHINKISLDDLLELVHPFREDKKAIRNRIRFGRKGDS